MEDETPNAEIGDFEQAYTDDQQDYDDHNYEQQQDQQFGSEPWKHIEPKDSIFTFFNNILKMKDSKKVANLDKRELGMLDLSVRNCAQLSLLGALLYNKSYSDFFTNKAEITLATSMSKKGWLPELVVSQKRFSQRSVQPISPPKQKKGFLGLGGKEEPQQQQ